MLVEPVAGSPWNGWPDVHGIGGRITVVRAPWTAAPVIGKPFAEAELLCAIRQALNIE